MTRSQVRGEVPTFMIGYSLGALIVLGMLIKYKRIRQSVAGAVLVSTPVGVAQNASEYARSKVAESMLRFLSRRFGGRSVPSFLVHTKSKEKFHQSEKESVLYGPHYYVGPIPLRVSEQVYFSAQRILGNTHELNAVPMCAVHGIQDRFADYQVAHDFFSNLRYAELVAVDGEEHSIWDGDQSVFVHDTTINWINARLEKTRRIGEKLEAQSGWLANLFSPRVRTKT